MARRKAAERSTLESFRWPESFRDPEGSQSLVAHRGWAHLVADLTAVREQYSREILYTIPINMEQEAQLNFKRGVVSGIERILEFEEELKEWRAERKQSAS